MKKVFLGGTANGSLWRNDIIPMLEIDYFNPVVEDWNEQAQQEELKQREICDYVLYVITPKMKGVYAIAEVIDDSNKRPDKTIFCFLENDGDNVFDTHQIKSLKMVSNMVKDNGAKVFNSLNDIALYLNFSRHK